MVLCCTKIIYLYYIKYFRASSVNLQQRCGITSKMHGGKYLKAEIVRKKGKQNHHKKTYDNVILLFVMKYFEQIT